MVTRRFMAEIKNHPGSHTSTTVIAVLTLIAAVIAALPGFFALNKEHAAIYYAVESSGIQIPDSLNPGSVRKVLSSNGIPSNTLNVDLINQGNYQADEVKVSIVVPGKFITFSSKPKNEDNPIWVRLPELQLPLNKNSIQFSVEQLGTTKPLTLSFGYQRESDEKPLVQVFYNGNPASLVNSVLSVPSWSPWDVFRIPLYILGGGLILVLIWAAGIVIVSTPKFKEQFEVFLIKVAREVVKSIYPFH